jgi:eukaryotic-like serine/threonine-protein kinase
MKMREARHCMDCGAELADDIPGGQCARCLMKLALGGGEDEPPTVPSEAVPVEEPGTSIGRYKLLERLGEGGFGTVWAAEQREPVKRRVALKIIKLGMDTKQVVARFEAERQALALMDHANIAKVLDAGATDNGRPYFVMELVRGIPITQYCERERLSTGRRLELFILVCQAVQHAHQKGIIHRDLKPSNILVTLHDGVPVPKVIDFGIAKATQAELTEKSIYTQFHQFIGTPAYMSPEQAELSGLDIDTRSDIYSLGVLLYELLTGTTPFDTKELLQSGLDEMRRIIREVEPMRPSTRLTHMWNLAESQSKIQNPKSKIEKDLDWIVMKCLEKDRARRYETANGLAADLRRHLDNEPVVACPPSAVYRLQKAFRRHRLGLTAAGAVVVALLSGIAMSIHQAVVANQERRAAQIERDRAQALAIEAERARLAEAEVTQELKEAVRTLRRQGYISDIQAAHFAIEDLNFRRAREMLAKHYPDSTPLAGALERHAEAEELRGFEWRYLWQQARGFEHTELRAHGDTVEAVAWSPDATLAATVGDDQIVRVWETDSWQLVIALRTSAQDRLFRGHHSLAFSPDGKWLVRAGASSIVVWETNRWTEVATLDAADYPEVITRPARFSATGDTLAAATARGISFWETGKWQLRHTLSFEEQKRGYHLAFSGDGRFFAVNVSGEAASSVELWDASARTKLHEFNLDHSVGLAFVPGGEFLVVGTYGGGIVLWNTITFEEVRRWSAHRGAIRGISFSPDGRLMATSGEDQVIRLWHMGDLPAQPQRVAELTGHRHRVPALAFAPDGSSLLSGGHDGTLRVWSTSGLSDRSPDVVLPGTVAPVWFSADGTILATIDPTLAVQYWDVATLQERRRVDPVTEHAAVTGFAMAPDGTTWALGLRDGTIELWDLETRARSMFASPDNVSAQAFCFSPDQRWLAAVHSPSADSTEIRIWNLAHPGRRLEARLPSNGSQALAYSPDGTRIAHGQIVGFVRLWDVATQRETPLPAIGRSYYSSQAVAFSADGSRIAAGGTDQTAWIHELITGTSRSLTGHRATLWAMAFSPDNRTLATGSADATVKLWNVASGHELLTFKQFGKQVRVLMFSPDGRTLAAGSDFNESQPGPVRLWRAPSWEEISTIEARAGRAENVP